MHVLFCDFQLFLKAVKAPFNLVFFPQIGRLSKMKTQNPCYDLKMKLVSRRLFLAQGISTVVGNMEGEGVDALPRPHVFRKKLEFPSHSEVKANFCSVAPHAHVLPLV